MKVKHIIAPFSNIISQNNLVKWTGRKTIFPYYHTVSNINLPYISALYPLKSIKDFEAEIDLFCNHFTPIDLDEVYRRIQSKNKDTKPAFHLTFDDGLKEAFDIIAPILEKKGIPATFFVNTDFIDNKNLFYRYKIGLILNHLNLNCSSILANRIEAFFKENSAWRNDLKHSLMALNYNDQSLIQMIVGLLEIDFEDWLLTHSPYLSTDQIKDLLKRGFGIGSHSKDHPRFNNLDLEEQKNQIEDSFIFLEDSFKIKERIFSFPFGDDGISVKLFDWMYKDGKCKMSFGVSGIKDDYCPLHMHRIPMDDCLVNPKEFINTEYLYFMLKSVFNKNQIKRK